MNNVPMKLKDVPSLLDDQKFPTTTDRLTESYGDTELALEDGSETLGEVLDRSGPETFHDPNQVLLTIYGGVSAEAVGRVGYSDRDPPPIGSRGPDLISL